MKTSCVEESNSLKFENLKLKFELESSQNNFIETKCNAPIPGRGPARHRASVPLRSPERNRRDTDVSLRHRIGKDDLCNTNMSRQNKNLTTTHTHYKRNAKGRITKSNYKDKCWIQVLRTKDNKYKRLS